jgi:hypothetical protein
MYQSVFDATCIRLARCMCKKFAFGCMKDERMPCHRHHIQNTYPLGYKYKYDGMCAVFLDKSNDNRLKNLHNSFVDDLAFVYLLGNR